MTILTLVQELATNVNAIANSITGDGVTDIVYVQDLEISLLDGDIFVVRKTTSDGSVTPDTNSYDTALSWRRLSLYNCSRHCSRRNYCRR